MKYNKSKIKYKIKLYLNKFEEKFYENYLIYIFYLINILFFKKLNKYQYSFFK